jgi:hypothetical protein
VPSATREAFMDRVPMVTVSMALFRFVVLLIIAAIPVPTPAWTRQHVVDP